jgi:uncharacterized protein YsxB (DUF464 family)
MNITNATMTVIQAIIANASSGLIGSALTAAVSVIVARKINSTTKHELENTRTEMANLKNRLYALTNNPLKNQELETATAEIQSLKEQIQKLTEEYASFTLSPGGFYVDRTGAPYCGAGCRDPLTNNRIPLKPTNSSWQYKCPKCQERYNMESPPPISPQVKGWDPLA